MKNWGQKKLSSDVKPRSGASPGAALRPDKEVSKVAAVTATAANEGKCSIAKPQWQVNRTCDSGVRPQRQWR
jgi:hypothetical protein